MHSPFKNNCYYNEKYYDYTYNHPSYWLRKYYDYNKNNNGKKKNYHPFTEIEQNISSLSSSTCPPPIPIRKADFTCEDSLVLVKSACF